MTAAPPHPDIDPTTASTPEEFAELLRRLRVRADQPSLRTIERWALKNGKSLSRATVADMLSGRTFPTKARLFAFMLACQVEPETDPRWEAAWNHLAEQRRLQPPGIRRLGAAGEEAVHALRVSLSPAETEELLEPTWADAEERLAAITNETAATVDLLQKQLAALRQAGAEVGTTLDNARVSRLAAHAAATLQRSMLPTRPPRLPGARIAHHYRPGDFEGGGDWFDAIQLSGGRMAFAVGDVMSSGLLSAAIMGQFRTSILTMAVLDLPPAQLLRHLDNLAQRLGTGHLATCLYAVYDPVARTLAVANAGHIPPVLARRYGHSELLQIPVGAPIGVGGVPFETAEVHVPDGSWLVLCTDPLVEMRSQEGYFSLAEASAVAIMGASSPDAVCSSLFHHFDAASPRNDDLALLVAHLEGLPPQDVAVWNLAMHPTEAGRAREITREQLGRWGLYDLIDTAELLVSELVTNALRSNSRHIELRMMRVGKLLIEVADEDFNLPKLQRADPDDEQGRGLSVVSRLSRRWGISRKAVGKVVWFELPTPPP